MGSGKKGGKAEVWYWAKTVSKPTYEVNSSEYQLGNHKFKYPGLLVWQDITITIVDVGAKAESLMKTINDFGYSSPTAKSPGINKAKTNCNITQHDSEGQAIETWTLYNIFIKSVNFGELDYSSDELVEIQLTLMYDWAELKMSGKTTKSSTNK
jgi:hypothetical protein